MPIKPVPREVVEKLVAQMVLETHDTSAKSYFKLYLSGVSSWDMTVPLLKRKVDELLSKNHARYTTKLRRMMLEFASEYGVAWYNTKSDEPMSVRKNMRFTRKQWLAIEKLAAAADEEPAAWARNQLVNIAMRAGLDV